MGFERKYIEILSTEWAEKYQNDYKRGPSEARHLLDDPQAGLQFFLESGFARAGGEQAGYAEIAKQALVKSIEYCGTYDELMHRDSPQLVWNKFTQICDSRKIGYNEKLNEGVVKGLVKLARSSVSFNPFMNLASKMVENPADAFLLLRKIHGIGDKIASFILRDMAIILDVEGKIAPENQILLQPVDRWVEGIATFLWGDLKERAPSWFIALKIIVKCREYNCSPARFNQGAWKYGSDNIKNTKKIHQGMRELLKI
jgi:hypothetical protein